LKPTPLGSLALQNRLCRSVAAHEGLERLSIPYVLLNCQSEGLVSEDLVTTIHGSLVQADYDKQLYRCSEELRKNKGRMNFIEDEQLNAAGGIKSLLCMAVPSE
jgi:hypothetical protein